MSSTEYIKGRKLSIIVTAGPTREEIDPVRFISNHSTGTFGYELAREAEERGHRVILISGPTALKPPSGVKIIRVKTAREMRSAILNEFKRGDCVIMAAAVSDWRPVRCEKRKIKRVRSKLTLELIANPDILAELGRKKRGRKILAGFAVESENLERNAVKKLRDKRLDFIVATKITEKKAVFGDNPIDVLMIDSSGPKTCLVQKSKRQLAKIIIDRVESYDKI